MPALTLELITMPMGWASTSPSPKDARVPITQGYELYNALKRQGVPAKMVVYPRQAHSIQEPKLQLDAATRNVEWFDQWLGTGSAQ